MFSHIFGSLSRAKSLAIPQEIIDSIRERITLSEIVSETVQLQPAGRHQKGLCPFHNEKTPSFTVRDEEGNYHCFGCGAHGSVFDFVMNTRGLTFPEAAHFLANRIGLKIPEASVWKGGERAPKRESDAPLLRKVVELVTEIYSNVLFKEPQGEIARTYLKERGIKAEFAKIYSLGFAPNSWDFIDERLKVAFEKEGIKCSDEKRESLLLKLGIVKFKSGETQQEGEEKKKPYDTFRTRLMFSITRSDGVKIAFGGRDLEGRDKTPKYINSPESDIYLKRKTFYGMSQAMGSIRATRHAFLVEGYFDVLSMVQCGFGDTIACCGTAVTQDHAGVLKRFVDRLTIVFDGDAAGYKAAASCFEVFLNSGVDVSVVMLSSGEDPDTLSQKHNKDQLEEFFAQRRRALDEVYVSFLFKEAGADSKTAGASSRGKIASKFVAQVARVNNPVERESLLLRASETIGVSKESLELLLSEVEQKNKNRESFRKPSQGFKVQKPYQQVSSKPSPRLVQTVSDRSTVVKDLLLALLVDPRLSQQVPEVQIQLTDSLLVETLPDNVKSFIDELGDLAPEGITGLKTDSEADVKILEDLLEKHSLSELGVIQTLRHRAIREEVDPKKILSEIAQATALKSIKQEVDKLRVQESGEQKFEDLQQIVQEKLLKRRILEQFKEEKS